MYILINKFCIVDSIHNLYASKDNLIKLFLKIFNIFRTSFRILKTYFQRHLKKKRLCVLFCVSFIYLDNFINVGTLINEDDLRNIM